MPAYKWIQSPEKSTTHGIYLERNDTFYPLAIIEFRGLGYADLQALLESAPDLLAACETALPVLVEYHRRHYLDFATDRDVRKAIAQLKDAIERVKGGGE